jgi:hypothetical protein
VCLYCRDTNKAFKSSKDSATAKHLEKLHKTKGLHVPFLNLLDNDNDDKIDHNDDNFAVANWRRLPRANIDKTFFQKCK